MSHAGQFQFESPQNRTFVYREDARATQGLRGLMFWGAFRCQTKENSPPQGKPKKIKGMTAPGGCVLCGGLKGPGAAPGAGDFKGTCERPGDAHEVRRTALPAQPVGLDAPIQDAVSSKAKGRPEGGLLL